MHSLAHRISQPSYSQDIATAIKRKRVFRIEALPGNNLFRHGLKLRIVGLKSSDHDLHAEHRAGDVDVGAVGVLVVLGVRARIDRQPGFLWINLGAHVQAAKWAFNVYFLRLLAIFCGCNVRAASG